MLFGKTLGLATLFATLASAIPTVVRRNETAGGSGGNGDVQIKNNLASTIYLWSVAGDPGKMHTLSAHGGTYQESFKAGPGGGGVSIKLATKPSQEDVLQFEYTKGGDTIYWDLSCINMGSDSEFTKYGFAVNSNNDKCPKAVCKAGDSNCADAYLQPKDDHATHGCPLQTHFDVEIGQ